MNVQLVSCGAQRPDKRAIAKMIEEISNCDGGDARELTEYLLEGSEVDIVISDGNTSSAFRALRKLDIDYNIMD